LADINIKGEYMDVLIMDMPKISGECRLPNFQGKIELLSFSHGVVMQMSGEVGHPERISGRPTHHDFAITKRLDSSSPLLNLACCTGADQGTVKITLGRKDKESVIAVMVYELSHVIISSVSISGGGSEMPGEVITLNYTNIVWTYTPSKLDTGVVENIKASWDVGNNRVMTP
jgi:type VI secretion system secreted protein Hcp